MEVCDVKWPTALSSEGDALVAPAPPVTCAHAEHLCRTAFGLTPDAVRPLPGERDRNFHIRTEAGEYVLKVAHPAEQEAVANLQTAALQHLAAVDPTLPVPRVVPCTCGSDGEFSWDDGGARPPQIVRCVTFIEGRSLGAARATAGQRAAVGRLLARIDQGLAGFRHPADRRRLTWDAHRAGVVRPLLEAIEDRRARGLAEEALDRFDATVLPRVPALRRQVIHNDFNPQNVLVSRTGHGDLAGVIDFGDLVQAPLVQDLATACAYQPCEGEHPLEVAAAITAAYHAVNRLDVDELEVLPALMAGRLVLSAAISTWRGRQHPDNSRYVLRNQALVWRNLELLMAVPVHEGPAWLTDRVMAAS